MGRATTQAHSDDDTIVAIITPPGEGGIAAIRLAGPASRSIATRHFQTDQADTVTWPPFVLRYGIFQSAANEKLDEVMAVFMPHGRSYTGLEQVEIFCHGGRLVVRKILDELIASGARSAEAGEFTRIAFVNGRIDLARAEAVAEIIAANTESALRASREHLLGAYSEHVTQLREQLVRVCAEIEASIDFPEEEISPAGREELARINSEVASKLKELVDSYSGGRIIADGFRLALAGRPNAGKSSLFNLLLRQERALVNPTPGTTRDYIAEWIDIEGVKVNVIDTAGLRSQGGKIEKLGQARAREIIADCHLVIWLVDLSQKGWEKKLGADITALPKTERMVVGNKVDLIASKGKSEGKSLIDLTISCRTGAGMKELHSELAHKIGLHLPDLTSGLVVTSARHKQKLGAALKAVQSANRKIAGQESPELIAFDLREASNFLDEITGKVYTEQILERIFAKFCIGK
jgi:tRNA modification GTPase